MPGSLLKALQELQQSELIKGAHGKLVYDKFAQGRLAEGQDYNIQASPCEVALCLTKFQ